MLSRVSDEWCFCYELSTCIGNFLNAYILENASVQEKTQKLANILDRKLFVQWLVFICVHSFRPSDYKKVFTAEQQQSKKKQHSLQKPIRYQNDDRQE